MKTIPPYPTELKLIVGPISGYTNATEFSASIEYWLKPRKISEEPPVFPCLMSNSATYAGWKIAFKEKYNGYVLDADEINYCPKNINTYWLPLPPAPDHLPDTEEKE